MTACQESERRNYVRFKKLLDKDVPLLTRFETETVWIFEKPDARLGSVRTLQKRGKI